MAISLHIQQDLDAQKRQALARVYALLLAEQAEIEAKAADIRESLFIHSWLDDETDLPSLETMHGGKHG